MSKLPGKQEALDAVRRAREAVESSLSSVAAPEDQPELDGHEDDAVKHARSALNSAKAVLRQEEDHLECVALSLKTGPAPQSVAPQSVAADSPSESEAPEASETQEG